MTDAEDESATPKEDDTARERVSESHDEEVPLRSFSPVSLSDYPLKSALKKPRGSKRYKKQASMGEFKLNLIFTCQLIKFCVMLH